MNIVLGVSGGIAAYKSVHLVRLLISAGHTVHVIPTPDALKFVGLATWEAISRNPVTTSVHEDVARVRHVALGQNADLVIVAPATANTLGKMAAGLADSLLGSTLLATRAPVLVAPAMHTEMWEHPATQHNLATLRARGVSVVGPGHGELAGGDTGPGRMSEPEEIAAAALALLAPQDLAGRHVLVAAGGTREPIDPVRFLGNRSSGRQGVALAADAARRGATVTLVASHIAADVVRPAQHPAVTIVTAPTAADVAARMNEHRDAAHVIVMTAAVADFRPAKVSAEKIRKEDGELQRLELVANDDILASLGANRSHPGQHIVGFAAETPSTEVDLLERARRKQHRKGVDLLVVNEVDWDRGFESADNCVQILGADGAVVASAAGSKDEVARAVWDAVIALG